MTIKTLMPKVREGRSLTGLEEWNPFLSLRGEMDKLFDNYMSGFEIEPFLRTTPVFQPKVNVADDEKNIKVSIELPGMDEKDIELSLTKEALTVKGEKKEEKEEKGENYHRMERSYGAFSRTIPLPVETDTDKVEATYKKGVLTVVIPKTERAVKETKKIPIKSQ